MEASIGMQELLYLIKGKKPLIHHITNYVTANDCANIVLAIGGSPIMAECADEVEDVVSAASALVINIGTFNSFKAESMLKAGIRANELGIPVILDPVGVGAIPHRKEAALKLMDRIYFSVIRGNLAEINSLCDMKSAAKGVASEEEQSSESKELALTLAKTLGTVAAITGKIDYISDGTNLLCLENGHEMLAKVTGTGCMSASLIGTYCGVTRDYLAAAAAGVSTMGIAGEIACRRLKPGDGTGSYKAYLMDAVYNFSDYDFEQIRMQVRDGS